MKKLFSFILVFYSLQSIAQQYQYVPMPTANAIWQQQKIEGYTYPTPLPTCVPYNMVTMISGKDTFLNNKIYKIVTRRVVVSDNSECDFILPYDAISKNPDFVFTAIREDNKKVYGISIINPPNEVLLYDFNAQAGDQMGYMGQVAAIDTININGTLRKRFFVTTYPSFGNDTVIEGIGSLKMGIYWETTNYHKGRLYCFTENGQYVYTLQNIPCAYIWPYGTPASVINPSNHKTNIYPNPFNEQLTVETGETVSLLIYNTLGVAVISMPVNDTTTIISTADLATGIYFVVLKDKNSQIIQTRRGTLGK